MHLTKRQKLVYDYISDSIKQNGYAPSIVEIGERFGLSSPATIHKHLINLESKGLIRRQKNMSRAIEMVEEQTTHSSTCEVPLLGMIAAGVPIETYPVEETISVPESMMGRGRTYVLKVKGESMIEEQIRDGDYVIVDEASSANNGDTVVALVNNDCATLKKFYLENGNVRLQPANSSMAPIIAPAEQVTIQGIVIGLLRKF
ncbi:MAG: transcriptional repressor LexA [Nitrospinota bacterium]|nr:transcriptional repressor LexA [Nitrospinota bacterium]MDH5677554.1 transcriptional repressor LexA [Nitrospinota bacterium]MDH5757050.1 transcriptional repressor LexA [Nitrospinota bacterium]